MAVVTFDPAEFKVLYPQFGTLEDAQLEYAFQQACVYLDNTDCSPVSDVATRKVLLYLLTAHICALNYGENGQAPSPIVGRISHATEGSVTVQADYSTAVTGSQAWYIQTRYGAEYWEMTASFRVGKYVPGCSGPPFRVFLPWRP